MTSRVHCSSFKQHKMKKTTHSLKCSQSSICTHFPLFSTQQRNVKNSWQKWLRALKIYMLACHAEIIHFTYNFNFMHPNNIKLYMCINATVCYVHDCAAFLICQGAEKWIYESSSRVDRLITPKTLLLLRAAQNACDAAIHPRNN